MEFHILPFLLNVMMNSDMMLINILRWWCVVILVMHCSEFWVKSLIDDFTFCVQCIAYQELKWYLRLFLVKQNLRKERTRRTGFKSFEPLDYFIFLRELTLTTPVTSRKEMPFRNVRHFLFVLSLRPSGFRL